MIGYFFNAQPTPDTVGHPSGYDRAYDAGDFNRYMGAFFTNGVFANENKDACKVTASGLRLTVAPGVAIVNGAQCVFETGDALALPGAGNYSVFCRWNNDADIRAFQLVAIAGGDFPPPVRAGDLYDLCLAHVTASPTGATVTDTRRDAALCGLTALRGNNLSAADVGAPEWLGQVDAGVFANPAYGRGYMGWVPGGTPGLPGGGGYQVMYTAGPGGGSQLLQGAGGAYLRRPAGGAWGPLERIYTDQYKPSVTGSFTGNDGSKSIELGFAPSAVLFWTVSGSMGGGSQYRDTDAAVNEVKLLLQGQGFTAIAYNGVGGAFYGSVTISGSCINANGCFCAANMSYNYIAFR